MPKNDKLQRSVEHLSRGQRLLGWATAMAILMGGVNAFVQVARVIMGH